MTTALTNVMSLDELQAFIEWLMISDPWPLGWGHDLMTDYADGMAQCHGFDNWIDAYHKLDAPAVNHAFSGSC